MNRKIRHNHKYPHFLIKNWNARPWSKKHNKRVNYRRRKDMGEKNYYPDDLEDNLAKIEDKVSRVFKKINNNNFDIGDTEWIMIILYIRIQTIRMNNICNYINEPDIYFKGYNKSPLHIYSSDNKDEIIKNTRLYVNMFLKLIKKRNWQEMSAFAIRVGLVIWDSKEKFLLLLIMVFLKK